MMGRFKATQMHSILAVVFYCFSLSLQDCARPTNLQEPNVVISPDKQNYGTWESFTTSCNIGYCPVTQTMPDTFYCTSGTPDYWSPDPSLSVCNVQCTRPNITDPDVLVMPDKRYYDTHDAVTVNCTTGGDISGPITGVCQSDGTWDPAIEPACLENCNATANSNATGTYTHGDEITSSCNPGYILSGGGETMTSICDNGNWNPPIQCDLHDEVCKAPANSNATGTYTHGDEITFSCDPGYNLSGGGETMTSICDNENWNPPIQCDLQDGDRGTTVRCNATTMTVILDRNIVGTSTSLDDIHFDDVACVAYDYDTSNVALSTTYDACLTTFETTDSTVKFLNNVIYQPDANNGMISRLSNEKIPVSCELDRTQYLDSSFVAQADRIRTSEQGSGNFSVSLLRYTNEFFNQSVVDLTAAVALGDPLYFAVSLKTVSGFIVFIRNCLATPSLNPNDVDSYSFLQEGCTIDETMVMMSPYNSQTQKFRIDAFTFIDENPQVYIHCETLVCENDPGSRCAQGCLSRRKRGGQQKRGVRSFSRIVSNGPIYSRRAVHIDESSSSTTDARSVPTSLLMLLIAGLVFMTCLTVAMTALLLISKRSQREVGRYRYQLIDDLGDDVEDDSC